MFGQQGQKNVQLWHAVLNITLVTVTDQTNQTFLHKLSQDFLTFPFFC